MQMFKKKELSTATAGLINQESNHAMPIVLLNTDQSVQKPKNMSFLNQQNYLDMHVNMLEEKVKQIEKEKELNLLRQPYKLDMVFSFEKSQDMMNQFFINHGFEINQAGIFLPESVVINAYNQGDLIIALKMQQVKCENWLVGVDTHCYNYDTGEVVTIPFQAKIEGMNYIEIFSPMPAMVNRGAGIKTRWKGLEDELNDAYAEYGDRGFTVIRTEMKFIGECYFLSQSLYEEFIFMRNAKELPAKGGDEKGNLLDFVFKTLTADLIKKGILDKNLQPINKNETSIPVNVLDYFYSNDEYSPEQENIKMLPS